MALIGQHKSARIGQPLDDFNHFPSLFPARRPVFGIIAPRSYFLAGRVISALIRINLWCA